VQNEMKRNVNRPLVERYSGFSCNKAFEIQEHERTTIITFLLHYRSLIAHFIT